MPNIEQQITGINKVKLQGMEEAPNVTCSCRYKPCPLEGKCNAESIVYKADLEDKGNVSHTYIGMTAEKFRLRYAKHTQSFRNTKYANETKLSKKVWEQMDSGHPCPVVGFSIYKHSRAYRAGNRVCQLCMDEKLSILLFNGPNLLNSRNEIFSGCRHRARFKMEKISMNSMDYLRKGTQDGLTQSQ